MPATNAAKGAEKMDYRCKDNETIKWYSHFGKQFYSFLKNKKQTNKQKST